MTNSIQRYVFYFVIGQTLVVHAIIAQGQVITAPTDHTVRVKTLSQQLLWHDESGMKQYDSVKDTVTERLLSEVDGFISDSFNADLATTDQVRAGLRVLLNHKKSDLLHNQVFRVTLPSGDFLIVGIEIQRGGLAIAEDSIVFRAYKGINGRFVYTASTGNLNNSALVSLHAAPLPTPPVAGEFWFVAWADVPPRSPYTIAMRLYAFDGEKFRTVWEPKDIIALSIDDAVQVNHDGTLVISQMPTFKSSTIVHTQYDVTENGPQQTAEWTTPID